MLYMYLYSMYQRITVKLLIVGLKGIVCIIFGMPNRKMSIIADLMLLLKNTSCFFKIYWHAILCGASDSKNFINKLINYKRHI